MDAAILQRSSAHRHLSYQLTELDVLSAESVTHVGNKPGNKR
jgi:hypothetical protein